MDSPAKIVLRIFVLVWFVAMVIFMVYSYTSKEANACRATEGGHWQVMKESCRYG